MLKQKLNSCSSYSLFPVLISVAMENNPDHLSYDTFVCIGYWYRSPQVMIERMVTNGDHATVVHCDIVTASQFPKYPDRNHLITRMLQWPELLRNCPPFIFFSSALSLSSHWNWETIVLFFFPGWISQIPSVYSCSTCSQIPLSPLSVFSELL